jgi:hypothetical protein
VEQSTRLLLPFTNDGALMIGLSGDPSRKSLFEKNAYYVDSSFFDIFT